MMSRRQFLQRGAQVSLASAATSLWAPSGMRAFGQINTGAYKAIVIISMSGGHDANNMLVPLDPAHHTAYAGARGLLALPAASCIPLTTPSVNGAYGFHPSLTNVAALFNAGQASVVANVGPMVQPATKTDLLANIDQYPDSLFSHPAGTAEWESASTSSSPTTGWGGRIADLLSGKSGSLPLVLNGGFSSIFTVGQTVQAVAVQGGVAFPALPPGLNAAVLKIAQGDCSSSNLLVSKVAQLRTASMQQQTLIDQAATYKTYKTQFPSSGFGSTMRKIAQIIGGQSVIGATRQIFYTQQGSYDHHQGQLPLQALNLADLDTGLGALFAALGEVGMQNQVLVCTHSDFNRTFTPNSNAGSDHGWGNHQLVLGGGFAGGTILGTMPALDINGPDDLNGYGVWVPTTSVTQLTAGVGAWMGLNSSQLATVFPELSRFPNGYVKFS